MFYMICHAYLIFIILYYKQLQLMTELDPETKSWLQSLKINKTFSSITDFQNGYNFSFIFDKLQLTKGKKFKNSSDLGCIFQNYKNVRDLLLENFNYDFPVNNIIYRTADILKVLRDQTTKYIEQKKIMTMKAATSVGFAGEKSLIQPQEDKHFKTRQKQISGASSAFFNQTSKMPKKIQDIEKKLDKFREQKTRHELVALEQRKQQIEQYRRVVSNNREYEIKKVKKIHEQTKQKQKKVFDVWYKTEQIKNQRIQTDKQFDAFQQSKRNKLLQTLRKDEVETINKGQEMFELNCMRQGIQLQHDPDKPLKPDGEFNKVVVMQRIKDNIIKHEVDKKQRIKRQNKKQVDAEQAKIQSQMLWTELNKVEDYSKKFSTHFQLCQNTYKIQKRMQAEEQTRKQKCKNKKYVDLPAYQDEQKRAEQFRQRKIQYLKNDVKWMENRWNKQYSIAQEIVEALLQVTIEGQQQYNKNQGFFYSQWKNIENRFMSFQDSRKKKNKDTKLYMDYSAFGNFLKQYITGQGSWKDYQHDHLESQQEADSNGLLTKTVQTLISISYPDQKAPESQKIPLYMPLKISFMGPRVSGKSSLTAKLAEKYGIAIINPKQLIKEALDLARPPVEEDTKKGAKKDTKKVEEITPQKLALKQFGSKLLQKFTTVEQAKNEDYINAIRFRVLQIFKQKNTKQLISQYNAAKEKEKARHEQALKDFEQAQKKPKKDSKKGGNQPAIEQPPKPNKCFYSTGFVIDDYYIDEQSIKLLQREFNGHISQEERINQKALQTKKSIQLVIPIPQPIKDNRYKSGTFDIIFSLGAEQQSLQKRRVGRKMDQQTKIIYHQIFNPAPDIKGFAEKLVELPSVDEDQIKSSHSKYLQQKQKVQRFYSVFGQQSSRIRAYTEIKQGEQSMQQTFDLLTKFIEPLLLAKYQQIQNSAQQNIAQQKIQPINKEQQNVQQKQIPAVEQNNSNIQKTDLIEKKQASPLEQQNMEKVISKYLSKQNSEQILNRFLTSIKKYQEEIKECLYGLQSERSNFTKQLLTVQKKFTMLINRPDDKAGKILGFQQNYNKLLAEKGNIVRDVQASKHLVQRLNQLYDSLWDAIGSKKNEAVEERIKFKQSNWLNNQCQRVVQCLKSLLQIQLNYLCETIFNILLLSCRLQNLPSDYMTQYLCLGIAPQLQPIPSVEPQPEPRAQPFPQPDLSILTNNKRLTYYIDQTNKCIDSLPSWIQQKYKKMKIQKIPAIQSLLKQVVQNCVANIKDKSYRIRLKVNQRVLEQRSYYQTLVNKMDDWIIQGIKNENDFVYQIYKSIKKSIQQAKRSNVKQLHVREITEILYPIRQLTLNPIPLRVQTKHKKLPVYSYMIFLQETKTLTNGEGKINFDVFKKYMDKRKKSLLLHPRILMINYDNVEQYLVKDGFLLLKELAIAVLLWDINVFDDDQLALFKQKLLKQTRTQQQKSYKQNMLLNSDPGDQSSMSENSTLVKKRLSVISAFRTEKKLKLNELILMDGFDKEEQYIVKHLLFEIFRQESNDYVLAQDLLDTLIVFDELQVLKYGDTVMMHTKM